jgi:hypothetical protein
VVPPDNDCPKSWSVDVAPYYSPQCTGGPPGCKGKPGCVDPGGPGQPGECPTSSARGPKNGPLVCLNTLATWPGGAFGYPNFCAANTTAAETRHEYQLEDQKVRDSAIGHLMLADKLSAPFFIGAGFHKPSVATICSCSRASHFYTIVN